MIFKLALSSMKSRLKDYVVLLIGLVMAISIFYMFETLALNDAFIKENSMISAVGFVFHAGSVLLAIITVAYTIYATSFLFSLRQQEFGMYMTLGAKKRKISLIMFIETMFIGLCSLVIGLVLGTVLASVVGNLLMKQLDFTSTTYAPFYLPSLFTTVAFFVILFLLAALFNLFRLSKVTALDLVHAESKAEHIVIRKKAVIFKAILSVILLVIGYYVMIDIRNTQFAGIIIALFAITSGTYLFFATFLPLVIKKLRDKQIKKSKRLNSFTYAQLSFRISQLSRVLATVAMLIALGMGAIAVGFAFQNNGILLAERTAPYDVAIANPTKAEQDVIDTMKFKEDFQYRFKTDAKTIYFNLKELKEHKPLGTNFTTSGMAEAKRINANPDTDSADWNQLLRSSIPLSIIGERDIKFVENDVFAQQAGKSGVLFFGKVPDFESSLTSLEKLDKLEQKRDSEGIMSKYATYTNYKMFASGTVFMGFFLGFAFLTMMASSLMFKILTGATQDIKRYQMLEKIGVRRRLLEHSIRKEMFLIFLFPGIIGFIHVAIGMEMFSFLMVNPYYRFFIPVLLFLAIYSIYYFITVWLYKGIVLKKAK
ncbi:ABC transporter permease [Listeria floridensis FSL S10-1187]|uniref:ABC transporter permease n=1 Tax=Listeria floridensis FSL S10-1187 TaxID=1265817 RepID=A0ABP3B1C3_9LIST|nr:ABC transporter permease [Listeria floridensis]EUJ33679.1 ABC transporter permease [Listeria floridensis FSL S10-1187]